MIQRPSDSVVTLDFLSLMFVFAKFSLDNWCKSICWVFLGNNH